MRALWHTLLVISWISFMAAGCQNAGSSSNDRTPLQQAQVDIRKSVVQYERDALAAEGEHFTRVLFVSISEDGEQHDPPAELLAGMTGPAPVKPYSQCAFQPDGISDNSNGARGVVLELGKAHFDNDDLATLTAIRWAAKGLGAQRVYHLDKEQGHWHVKDCVSLGAQ